MFLACKIMPLKYYITGINKFTDQSNAITKMVRGQFQ